MFLFNRKMNIPSILKKFNETFTLNGFSCYLVGGAVRDMFLHKSASDWDVATNATPQDVIKMFKFVVPTGIDHGTVTVHFMNKEIEVTTFRTESGYSDGRHPDTVNYAATIQEDLSRRDFTINAIAINLNNGKVIDPFKGKKDIKRKIIRTVGNPYERFMEDGLRPIRAIRFSSKLNFKIENKTLEQISNSSVQEKIHSISVERFRDELLKIMQSETPSISLLLLEKTKILDFFMPEIIPCRNCTQKDDRGYHVFDVMDHCLYACDGAPKNKPLLRLAAFLHDCGKPTARTVRKVQEHTIINFYSHETYSVEIAEKIMTRLRFSNSDIFYVCHLIKNHMFKYEESWSDAAIRRFLVKIKPEYIDDLIELRFSDMSGKYNEPISIHDASIIKFYQDFKDRLNAELNKQNALSIKDLCINGNDLINFGIPKGKQIGIILDELLNCVLEDPLLNTKEKLLEIAKNYIKI